MRLFLLLLLPMALLGGTAAAQHTPAVRAAGLPQLPETALLSASSTSVLPPSNGRSYQYQSVRVYNDEPLLNWS